MCVLCEHLNNAERALKDAGLYDMQIAVAQVVGLICHVFKEEVEGKNKHRVTIIDRLEEMTYVHNLR